MARPPTSAPLPLWRQLGVLDAALLLIIGTFVVWVWGTPGQTRLDTVLDYATFSGIGVVVAVLQFQAARASLAVRERLAWRLLSASSVVRVASGIVWSLWIVDHPGQSRPVWLLALGVSSLLLVLAGLLAFGSEPRLAVDRLRLSIDGIIVLVGSGTALWFAALGPFFSASGAQEPRVEDYFYLLADSASVIVAALLVLRRSQRYFRRVATLLLGAALLQTVPDVLLWAGKANYSYRAGDGIAVLWFSVWVLKAAAARYALQALRFPTEASLQRRGPYESGVVPVTFVALGSLVLMVQLATAPQQSELPLVISVGALSLLLVIRQLIEIREQDRVQRAQHQQASWYSAVLRDSNDYVMVLDADGNSLDASPAAHRLLNLSNAASRWALLALVHPDDQLALRRALRVARDAPASLAIRVPGDEPAQWRQLALTIVDRRQDVEAEAILLHAQDITREMELTGRLRQTQELEALGVFAGGLAHDLNNILTVIDAHAEMLEDDLHIHQQLQQDVSAIRMASQRARRFTRGLLALSRHKQAQETGIQAEKMLRARIQSAGLEQRLTLVCEGELATVQMDQGACHLAVDSVLLAILEAEPDLGPVLQVQIQRLQRAEADALQVEPGPFLLLQLSGLTGAGVASPTAPAVWDGSTSQLALLLARAAAREVGGAQRVTAAGTVLTYLPVGGRA